MSKQDIKDFRNDFVEQLKAKINVAELYTELTKEPFIHVKAKSRNLAKVVWRSDVTPSLSHFPAKNILTDFAGEPHPETGKPPSYNPIDIFMLVGGAATYTDAILLACKKINIEFPREFKRKDEDSKQTYNIGEKIREVWSKSKDSMNYYLENPSKRPASLVNFFNDRNIPFDKDFIETMQLGFAPSYEDVKAILFGHGILAKDEKNEGDEKMIFRKDIGNNGLVFPLYDHMNRLLGLKFRQLDKKDFAFWVPFGPKCFYNMQNFQRRPRNRRLYIFEGEMNLVAYGIAAYRYYKDKENIREELENAMRFVYCTGSKGSNIDILQGQVDSVAYFPDYDTNDLIDKSNTIDHPIIRTISRISKELDCNDLEIVDWSNIANAHEKYDLENFLKSNDYDMSKITNLTKVSLAQYIVNQMHKYLSNISNTDNKFVAQIKLTDSIKNLLPSGQRESFLNKVKEQFNNISEEDIQEVLSNESDIKYGNFKIDSLGQVVEERLVNNQPYVERCTNFYYRIIEENTHYNEMTGQVDKFYVVEIVRGKNKTKGHVTPDEINDDKKMQNFGARIDSVTDMKIYKEDFKFQTIVNLMRYTKPKVKRDVFKCLGRPFESYNISKFKTENFCLMPKVSVINGEIVQNSNFEIQLYDQKEIHDDTKVPKYEWMQLNEDQFREAGSLFWNNLRYVHDTNVMNSLISVIFDACCVETQGSGIVDNEHGFAYCLEGSSGTQKTTAIIEVMCLLGKFSSQNHLMNWSSTANAMEHQLIKIGNLVAPLDELKMEITKESEMILVFDAIYGGKTRSRLASLRLSGGATLRCSVFVTAEGSNGNLPESIASRILVIRLKDEEDKLKLERKKHIDIMNTSYKFNNFVASKKFLLSGFMPRMVAWQQRRDPEFYPDSLSKWKKEFTEIMIGRKNPVRQIDMITRIVSAFEQVVTFCVDHNICTKEEGSEEFESFVLYWKKQIKEQMRRVSSHSSGNKVVQWLCQLIHSQAIPTKTFIDGKWKTDPKWNYSKYLPLNDVTFPDPKIGRKLLLTSSMAVKSLIESLGETKIVNTKFIQDLIEEDLIDSDDMIKPKLYNPPDDKGNMQLNVKGKFPAIDYNKLMEKYNSLGEE